MNNISNQTIAPIGNLTELVSNIPALNVIENNPSNPLGGHGLFDDGSEQEEKRGYGIFDGGSEDERDIGYGIFDGGSEDEGDIGYGLFD